MAMLPKLTRKIRFWLKVCTVFIFLFFAYFFGSKIVAFIQRVYYPPKPLRPQERFGKLPRINFPTQEPRKFTYKINTFSGTLPFFSDKVEVYAFRAREQKLLDLKNARERVRGVDFATHETPLSNSRYQWNHTKRPNTFIIYDIVTRSFEMHSDYLRDDEVVSARNLPADNEQYKKAVFEFLGKIGEDILDIDTEKTSITYLKLSQQNRLTQTDEFSEAQIVRVDLFQKPIDQKPIYYEKLGQSNMYFLLGSGASIKTPRIVEAHFNHLVVDKSNHSTYPLKPAFSAYQELITGNAYITNLSLLSEIEIADVSVAYYIGIPNQQYLIPIIVFDGRGFKAYVDAIPTSVGK